MKPRAAIAMLYPFATVAGIPGPTLNCLLQTLLLDSEDVFGGAVLTEPCGVQVDMGRNRVVARFLDHHDREWLYFTDSDQVWNHTDLYAFIQRARPETPIISGLYHKRTAPEDDSLSYPIHINPDECSARINGPCVHDCPPLPLHPGGRELIPACTVPGGALLLHRSMLSDMRKEYGDNWFSTFGPGMAEDAAICERAIEMGFPVMADPMYRVGHLKVQVI